MANMPTEKEIPMRILMICKYPPIQGGVSAECYWTTQLLAEMGHDVSVLTNAQEVEEEYRIAMSPEDEKLLYGFSKPNSVAMLSTHVDRKHVFVPQTNPSVSKLLNLGLEMVETAKPDFIWAHYLEPYGVVAMMLSKITGIPYVFKHAGSDIGRLMITPQLRRLYHEVLRNAAMVMTYPHHHERFTSVGVSTSRLGKSVSVKIRPELFFPTPFKVKSPLTLGVYGKVGESKGTGALLEAMASLKGSKQEVRLLTHWGGRNLDRYLEQIDRMGISDMVQIEGFVPHWRIPDFIHSCDAVLFLENRFSITFHHPSIPFEVLACGRPVITTKEVAGKRVYDTLLKDGENAFIIEGDITGESVTSMIKRTQALLEESGEILMPRLLPETDLPLRIQMKGLLESIEVRL